MNISTLADLSSGCRGRVNAINISGNMRRRLMDMGFIEGTEIVCLNPSPSGDPTAYFIRGTVIALRKRDAAGILVSHE